MKDYNLDNLFGVFKAKVETAKNLYYPVLPIKNDQTNKLLLLLLEIFEAI